MRNLENIKKIVRSLHCNLSNNGFKDLTEIVNEHIDDNRTPMFIATIMCDYMLIERRHNRTIIVDKLSELKVLQ